MRAGDLQIITLVAKSCPDLLEHLIMIYHLGRQQGIIDYLKEENRSEVDRWGINLSNELGGN